MNLVKIRLEDRGLGENQEMMNGGLGQNQEMMDEGLGQNQSYDHHLGANFASTCWHARKFFTCMANFKKLHLAI
jgi:hypothetical protein